MSGDQSHEERTRLVAGALQRGGLVPGEPYPCPYLPGRTARPLTIFPSRLAPGVYHSLMDLNFRRLGTVFYRPACPACQECRVLRVPVLEFRPSRSQRRCWRRNQDLSVEAGPLRPTGEKHELYRRYLRQRHRGAMDGSPEEFASFLYTSGIETLELTYRLGERLVASGIVDLEPAAMSAVYCYFEPDLPERSLGVFNVLSMIEECRRRGLAHLYLGFYVRDSPQMNYKGSYRPAEVWDGAGRFDRLA